MKLQVAAIIAVLSSFGACVPSASHGTQLVFSPSMETDVGALEYAISAYPDPVELMRLIDPEHAAELDEPRLLQVFGKEPQWMTEGDKLRLHKEHLGFMDLTGEDIVRRPKLTNEPAWPKLKYQSKIKDVISHLSTHTMRDALETFTSFFNRFYKSHYGAQSSHWLYLQVLDIVAKAPPSIPLSVEKFKHAFPQSSVIARFEPPTRNASLPIIIIGAHQDSANYRLPLLPAPGADDDGSGTVTILEAFRALVEKGFTPQLPVEFHWYAGEEGGLLGSRDIVKEYVALGKNVRAMIQFDMTAYTKQNVTPTITLITSDSHKSLTKWTMSLAEEYAYIAVQGADLFPGAGSDHMSWYRADYPACFATEGDPHVAFDPYVHTVNDRIDLPNGEFSFEHALEFSKLAVGFAVELGDWVE